MDLTARAAVGFFRSRSASRKLNLMLGSLPQVTRRLPERRVVELGLKAKPNG